MLKSDYNKKWGILNKKYLFDKISTFFLIGVIFVPTFFLFKEFGLFSQTIKSLDYTKVFLSVNSIILIISIFFIKSKKKLDNLLINFISAHFSLSIFLSILFLSKVSFIYVIISLISIIYLEYLKNKYPMFIEKTNNEELFQSRKLQAQHIISLLNDKNEYKKKLILIDGEWGTGKTFFIEKIFQNTEIKDFYQINLDILMFNDKNHIIEQCFNEIKKILENSGYRSNTIPQLKKMFKFITQSQKYNFTDVFEKDSLETLEKELKYEIMNLQKPICILVDNLERVLDKDKIINALGFIHKMYEMVNKNIKIIILADSKKILNLDGMDKDYLNKFFDEVVILNKIFKDELLTSFIPYVEELKISTNIKIEINDFINAINEIEYIKTTLSKQGKYDENTNRYLLEQIIGIDNKLHIARNLKKIINDTFTTTKCFTNKYKSTYTYNDEIFIRQVILVSIFNNFSGNIRSKKEITSESFEKFKFKSLVNYAQNSANTENSKELVIDKNEYEDLFLEEYFKSSFKSFYYEEDKTKILKTFSMLLNNKDEKYEMDVLNFINKLEKNEKDIVEETAELFRKFIYFVTYFDINSKALELYKVFFELYIKGNKLQGHQIFYSLLNEEFLKLDQNYSEEYEESIFNYIDYIVDNESQLKNRLIRIHFDGLYKFAKINFLYKKNKELLYSGEFYKEFLELCNINYTKKNELDILKYIDSLNSNNNKPIKSLKGLFIKFNKINGYPEYDYKIQNTEQVKEFSEKLINLENNNFNEIDFAKEKLISSLLKNLIEEEMKNLFDYLNKKTEFIGSTNELMDYINNILNDYLGIVKKDFRVLIARKMGEFSRGNHSIFRWKLNTLKSCIDSKKMDLLLDNFINEKEDSTKKLREFLVEIHKNINQGFASSLTYEIKKYIYDNNYDNEKIIEKLLDMENDLVIM